LAAGRLAIPANGAQVQRSDAVNHRTFAARFGRKAFTVRHVLANEIGILRRILYAIFELHETKEDRETIPFVAGFGGTFTDGIEREIMQRNRLYKL
jgi:hypothetical protein